jgi:hypothetical protein
VIASEAFVLQPDVGWLAHWSRTALPFEGISRAGKAGCYPSEPKLTRTTDLDPYGRLARFKMNLINCLYITLFGKGNTFISFC